jgi:hypothetical protein
MTAPPARPHILRNINAPARWSLGSANDWGEGDAWDSGSDSESKTASKPAKAKSPSHSVISNKSSTSSFVAKSITVINSVSTHRPDPIPIPISPPRKNSLTSGTVHRASPSSNSTSGADRSSTSVNNLAFSYTHVQHPSPSSFPPTGTLSSHPESDDIDWQEQERDERERAGWTIVQSDYDGPDVPTGDNEGEADGGIVLGDLEPTVFDADDSEDEPIKEGKDAIKPEADEIIRGQPIESLLRLQMGNGNAID